MGIFEKRESLSREELKSSLSRDSGIIPKTGGQKFSQGEREKLGNVLNPKYGSNISKNDYRSAVKELENARDKTQNPNEKKDLVRQIDYLKRVGGM